MTFLFNYETRYTTVLGTQWRSGEKAPLPPEGPGFESR